MSTVLRTIAEAELDQTFPDLKPQTRNELATSLVRQWVGNNGSAVIMTREVQVWFRLKKLEDNQTQVVRECVPQTFVDHMRKSRVVEEEIPALLHELNLCQSVQCLTDYGQPLRLRVDPAKPMFFVELVLDEDELHRYPNG